MTGIFTQRMALAVVCAGALALAACGNGSSSSTTTTASPVPADATIVENFARALPVGGGLNYAFNMAQYGNVAVTLTDIAGVDLPDGLTLNVGIGRPSGTTCITSTTLAVGTGTTPQVNGVYGPGIYCVRVSDAGVLTGQVDVKVTVAHS